MSQGLRRPHGEKGFLIEPGVRVDEQDVELQQLRPLVKALRESLGRLSLAQDLRDGARIGARRKQEQPPRLRHAELETDV